jgi:hypothetical protein
MEKSILTKEKAKNISKNALDGLVQTVRANLFYPELIDEGDGYRPKGIAQALIVDPIIGAIIGSQINPEHIAIGAFCGLIYPVLSGVLIGVPVSYGINQLKVK